MATTLLAAYPTRPYASRESAGVFRNRKELLRTLYSWEMRLGNAPIIWDRLHNDGSLVTDLTGVTIEVEGNNIEIDWAGTINNTSTQKTGPKVFTNSHQAAAMIPAWGYTYIFTGYEEGEGSPGLKIDLAKPNEKIAAIKKDTAGINRVAKDGNYLYGAAMRIDFNDGAKTNTYRTGVVVMRQLPDGTNEYVELPGSVRVGSGLDQPYYMLAQLNSAAIPEGAHWDEAEVISDLDVNDRYLYVAREGKNSIEVRDKANNQLAATLSIPGPHRITLVGNNKLWVSSSSSNKVAEYDLGEGITATVTGRVLPGINECADLDTSPNGTKLLVLDGNRLNDTRKLTTYAFRVYDVASLEQVFTYGRPESYGDDATIYDDKLLPINTKSFEKTPKTNSTGFVAWQDDNRFWGGDCGNDRNLLINLTTKAIEARVGWRGYHYACSLVANDTWTMLQDYTQLTLDPEVITTQGITATNGAYRATHNFALQRRAEYDDKYNRLAMPTKFDNGRTFAILQHQRPDDGSAPDFHLLLVEKTATQIVYTDQKFPIGYCINEDQSLTYYESTDDNGNVLGDTGRVGALLTMWKRPKVGYNANGVPQFGPRQVAFGPIRVKLEDPITEGGGLLRNTRTDSGVYMTYSTDVTYNKPKGSRGGYYHTGTIGEGEQKLRARFSPSTLRDWYEGEFPEDDKYEDANGTHYSGSYYQAIGDTLLTGANCEFYKGKAVFKWKGYNPLGLLRFVAGQTNNQGNPLGPAPAAYATNSTRGDFATYKDCIVHVSGDEGAHAGSIAMVYKRFDTIWSQSLPLQDYTPPVDASQDLLAGLPKQSFVPSGTAGWTVSAASGLGLLLLTGRLETDGTDLLADFDGSLPSATASRAFDVPAGPWEHSIALRFTRAAFPQQAGEVANVDYLDTSGRLISSTGRREITNDNCPLLFNEKVAGSYSTEAWRPYATGADLSQAVFGVGADKRPYVEYAGFPRFYVDSPADPTADVHALGSIRLRFQNAGNRSYGINLYDSRLSTLSTTAPTIPTTPTTPARMAATVPAPAPAASQLHTATYSAAATAHRAVGGRVLLRARLPRGVAGPWTAEGEQGGAAVLATTSTEPAATAGAQTITVTGATWFGDVGIRTAGGKSFPLAFGTGYTFAAGQLNVLAAAGVVAGDVLTYTYASGNIGGAGAGGPTYTAGDGIDITGNVISVEGKADEDGRFDLLSPADRALPESASYGLINWNYQDIGAAGVWNMEAGTSIRLKFGCNMRFGTNAQEGDIFGVYIDPDAATSRIILSTTAPGGIDGVLTKRYTKGMALVFRYKLYPPSTDANGNPIPARYGLETIQQTTPTAVNNRGEFALDTYYLVGDLVNIGNVLYLRQVEGSDAGAFDPTKWAGGGNGGGAGGGSTAPGTGTGIDFINGVYSSTRLEEATPQTGDYTLQLTDAGILVPFTNTAPVIVTFPDNASVPIPRKTIGYIRRESSGPISLQAGPGVQLLPPGIGLNVDDYAKISWHKKDFNTYWLEGSLY